MLTAVNLGCIASNSVSEISIKAPNPINSVAVFLANSDEIFNFSAGLNSIKTEDWKTSISLLHKIKSFKNPKALNLLGTALRFGNELPKSAVESQKLHTKSAQLGNMSSQTVLATYLTKGLGIKKSKKHAFLILNKTAHEGISTGVYNFITMLKNGVGVNTAVLIHKPHTSCFTPNVWSYTHKGDEWVLFPWENKNSDSIQDYLKEDQSEFAHLEDGNYIGGLTMPKKQT